MRSHIWTRETRCAGVLSLAGCLALGCDASSQQSESAGDKSAQDTAKVSGGTASGSKFPQVVAIVYDENELCSGTVIARNVVLTAAHCTCGVDKSKIVLYAGPKAANPISYKGQQVRVKEVILGDEAYCKAEHKGINDLALLITDLRVDDGLGDNRFGLGESTKLEALDKDVPVRAVGYGFDEGGVLGTKRDVGGLVYSGDLGEHGYGVAPYFRASSDLACGLGAMPGDSGGPVYQGTKLVAVATASQGKCPRFSITAPFEGWVADAIRDALRKELDARCSMLGEF